MKIFVLKKSNPDIANDEVTALSDSVKASEENIIVAEMEDTLTERLGFTRHVLKYLFHCNKNDLETSFEEFNWEKTYSKSFRIRTHGKSKEKELAKIVWNKVSRPKVDLETPETPIEIYFKNDICFVGVHMKTLETSISRKAHKRPFMHPTSQDPSLSRAMINLTGIRKGKILDPFCGSGGILIEAGLMGLRPEGYDIDKEMLDGCKENLKHFKIKDFKLKNLDSTKIDFNMDYIVTDLPYMRNTKGKDFEVLYKKFFKVLKKHLKKRAVIGLPDFVKIKAKKQYKFYLHKSLSKKIVIVQP